MRKTSHIVIKGTIHCVSGLRIGGSDDLLQIGGTDLTCIKHPVTREPYVPGTSIKGKLRSELERRDGIRSDPKEPCGCAKCMVCRVFGPHKNTSTTLGPTRIIVRDARLLDSQNGAVETKTENVIDRLVGTALHPRQIERVAAGAKFGLQIGIQVFDIDKADELFQFVAGGLRLVQQTGIGAGISKGSGEIELHDLTRDGEPFAL